MAGVAWDILEGIARGVDGEDDLNRLTLQLSSEELSWDELIGLALRHQMLPMLAYYIFETNVHEKLPHYLVYQFSSTLKLNRHRLSLFRKEAATVIKLLTKNKIQFVATKGITFDATLYGSTGTRMLKDIDFMIPPDDREQVRELIASLGYQTGRYDWKNDAIMALDRRMHINYVMNPDHLPRNARLTDDPCIPYLYIDFANSLTWHKSPWEIPVAEAMVDSISIPLVGHDKVQLPCFAPQFQFIFTVLHLFREAWLEQWVTLGYDVNLMKFGDVIRLHQFYYDALTDGSLIKTLKKYNILEPVHWVIEHLDRTFSLDIATSIGLTDKLDENWLAGAQASHEKDRSWTGNMKERLQSKDREKLFK